MSICCHRNAHHHREHNRDFDPHCAFEAPFVLVNSCPHNGQFNVSPDIKAIKLFLRREFHNEPELFSLGTEIDMWHKNQRVPIRIRTEASDCGFERTILVKPLHPLKGGAVYKVRVKAFFVDRFGVETVRARVIVFFTRCR